MTTIEVWLRRMFGRPNVQLALNINDDCDCLLIEEHLERCR